MNNDRNLLKRLLRLYPIKLVKESFSESGNAEEAIEAISGNFQPTEIKNFAKNNYLLTRQHIYIFSLNSNYSPSDLNQFPLEIVNSSVNENEYFYFCLPKIRYEITLYNPLEEAILEFLQPVVIRIINNKVFIHVTKIEKTVSAYFPFDRYAVRRGQTNTESKSVELITDFLDYKFGLTRLDINKGIKTIWDNDFIDGRKVQWRKNSSVTTETMDEDFLFKQKYPAEYIEMTSKPLVKTLFKYIKEDDYLCDTFDSDPTNGLLNIPKFPKNANQILNVIAEILTYN